MSRKRSMRLWPIRNSSALGTVNTGSPVAEARSSARRRCARLAAGMATTTCVAVPQLGLPASASKGPSTDTPLMRAPCLVVSSSSRPNTTQPCW